MLILNRFLVCFNLFVLLFLVIPWLVVAVQLCMAWIPNKKKFSWWSMFHVNIVIGFGVMTVTNRKPTWGEIKISLVLIRVKKVVFNSSNSNVWKAKLAMCHSLNLNLKEASYTMGTSIKLDSFQISLQNWFIKESKSHNCKSGNYTVYSWFNKMFENCIVFCGTVLRDVARTLKNI